MNLQAHYETLKGEQLKTAAELALHEIGPTHLGSKLLEYYAFGAEGRVVDDLLKTSVAGIQFENPLIVGAGWDKKGWTLDGLRALGFAGAEVGTVTLLPQSGNPTPRLWTINPKHSVGMNRMGFNNPGAERVREYLEESSQQDFQVGISVGRNKLSTNEQAIDEHAEVIQKLGKFASYFTLAVSSPNTPGLRDLQKKEFLPRLIMAARRGQAATGRHVPLFLKIDGERSPAELDDIIEVSLEHGADGIIAINTYQGTDIKTKYGKRWAGEAGGLSGADKDYQDLSTKVVRYVYEQAGDKLTVIGAGGINNWVQAYNKLSAGASAVQIVTAMRESRGRVAAKTLRGLLEYLSTNEVKSVQEIIGVNTSRGTKKFS